MGYVMSIFHNPASQRFYRSNTNKYCNRLSNGSVCRRLERLRNRCLPQRKVEESYNDNTKQNYGGPCSRRIRDRRQTGTRTGTLKTAHDARL